VTANQAPTDGPTIWAKLREPFPAEKIGKLPKPTIKNEEWKLLPREHCDTCGGYHPATATIHLEFVGHADTTDRLLSVDPEWNWEPVAWDGEGLPRFAANEKGQHVGLWIKLTIGGVTRLGYGSVEGGAFDAEKQLIGDALRNAAMRFGVALDLWRKDVHAEADGSSETHSAPAAVVPCPKCGLPLRNSTGPKGTFVGCSSYKGKSDKGCGFTADGTLADFAKGEAELGDAEIVPATPDRGEMVATGVCHACQARGLTAKSGKAVTWHTPSTGGPPVCTGFDPVTDEFVRHPMTVEGQASDELPPF
jgi:ssDNA-binding Zn-finger/Zn-ribbon topoisomerase 1